MNLDTWCASKLDVCQKSFLRDAIHGGSVLAAEADELQEEEEQGDNVQIEVESSKHVLLGRDFIPPVFPTQDKLGIKHQV